MRCDEFETRLNACLDARRDPESDEQLSLHAQDCECCRQLADAYSLINESLRYSDRPEPSEGLTSAVLAEAASSDSSLSDQTSTGKWSVWTHVALASAAALLVAVMLPRERTNIASTAPAASAKPATDAVAQVHPAATPVLPAGQLAREATARYASLARTTSDSLAGALAFWQPTAPATTEPKDDAMLTEMAAGLRPLADSTTGAFRFLLDVLPQGEAAPVAPSESIEPAANQRAT